MNITKVDTDRYAVIADNGEVVGEIRKTTASVGQSTTSGRVQVNQRTVTRWRVVGDPYHYPFTTRMAAARDIMKKVHAA